MPVVSRAETERKRCRLLSHQHTSCTASSFSPSHTFHSASILFCFCLSKIEYSAKMRTVFAILALCVVLAAAQDPVAPIRGGKTGKQPPPLHTLCPLLLCTLCTVTTIAARFAAVVCSEQRTSNSLPAALHRQPTSDPVTGSQHTVRRTIHYHTDAHFPPHSSRVLLFLL